ncbi:chitinase [Pseudoalteromonas sp. SW0106-04]|uniref:chitinase n=1 Tax=Pseudoalteromonas sp. SW0106-04 TaxID=1702169 RepID=UPI0006B520EC|nr:chitinase [Pseudoalteromonas sp. SW0106-04]GAP76230.1 chitinase [Pseudoalteromonas sp. SW0106-04]
MSTTTQLFTVLGISAAVSTAAHAINVQPDPHNPEGYVVAKADVEAMAAAKTADPMYQVWAQALRTRDNAVVEAIVPGSATNPENVQRAQRVFPQQQWDFLTQMAAPEYTYTRFLRAIGKFPAFCGDYSDGRDADAICKRSIVTAFAHFAQETGGHISKDNVSDNPMGLEEWQQALVHVREMGWSEGEEGYTTGCGQNDWQNRRWPCAPGQGYFGRGAKQLSYHFNYGAFSEVMFDGDATVLLNNPALVADSWLNLASAIWFFLTPQAPKPAMLHVIDRTWVPSQRERNAGIGYGFGTTINVINGGIECGEQNKYKGQPVNRIRYWQGLAHHYNIVIESDEEDTCWQQTPYGSLNLEGATDVLYTNWEGDWGYYADRPGGYSFECKLVGYQTAYSALVPGDYEKCVTNFYQSHAGWPQVRVSDSLPSEPPTEPPVDGVAAWDAATVYVQGEQVSQGGQIYEAKWWTQGDDPLNGGPWQLIDSGGQSEPTPPSDPVDPAPGDGANTWDAATIYVGGDQASKNGVLYQAKWWTQGDDPINGGPWQRANN